MKPGGMRQRGGEREREKGETVNVTVTVRSRFVQMLFEASKRDWSEPRLVNSQWSIE